MKLSKTFLVSAFAPFHKCPQMCCRWLRLQDPAEEMFSVCLITDAAQPLCLCLFEVKTNTRQQLLVKYLKDGRLLVCCGH